MDYLAELAAQVWPYAVMAVIIGIVAGWFAAAEGGQGSETSLNAKRG